MTEQEASELLKKYKDGLCTPEELAFMEGWYKDLKDSLPDVPYNDADGAAQRVWQMALAKQVMPQKSIKRYYWPVAAAAAAACVLVVSGIVYLSSTNKDEIKPGQAADFLFLGIGASASPQKPIFPIILPILNMIVATILFIRKRIIDNLIVYIICLSSSLILLYVHVLSKI